MRLKIIDSEPPASETEIKECETELGVRLPEDYRKFLRQSNGGEFEVDVEYPLLDPPDRGTGGFREFYSVDELDEAADTDIDGLIAIALDETGEICLACGGQEYGKVYFVDSDRGVSNCLCLVANNFTEFLNSIAEAEDV